MKNYQLEIDIDNGSHYQKLLSFNGTKVADDFRSLDEKIVEYLKDQSIDNKVEILYLKILLDFQKNHPPKEYLREFTI